MVISILSLPERETLTPSSTMLAEKCSAVCTFETGKKVTMLIPFACLFRKQPKLKH